MRMTRLFNQTLRESPVEAQAASHQLMVRAGYIRPLASGIYSFLPLGYRSIEKISRIIREEINKIGGQELQMPLVQPAEIWKESGRWYAIDAELSRFKDRNDRELVLGMTHEEVVADLARKLIKSYKQLPALIYQIQTKFRDDPRPRAGLIRVREFMMKDSYSLDADWNGLEEQYRAHYQAYFNIFRRCGLEVMAVRSDTGIMGGKLAHEFMVLAEIGEDTIILCPSCGYAANQQVATFKKTPKASPEPLLPLARVATPGCKSIEALAEYLHIGKDKTAKAVFLVAEVADSGKIEEQLVFAIVRGDMEVNETKLAHWVKARSLRPATEEEIIAVGATPGYASPINIQAPLVIVDDLIPLSQNLVSGANEEGFHYLNVNYGRDFQARIVADICSAQEGDACLVCEHPLKAERAIEVGNIFQLGVHFSTSMGCTYTDEAGRLQPIVMGSYGIGIGRLLATIAEKHHDSFGLQLPVTVAPYQVHLLTLKGKDGDRTTAIGDRLYTGLLDAHIETLYDDRDESPGVKFNDADLIGLPIRLTVSNRSVNQGEVEIKYRHADARVRVAVESAIPTTRAMLDELDLAINTTIKPVEYKV